MKRAAPSDVLSPAELAFRDLLSRPTDYAAWAHDVRCSWERAQVVWFHGFRNGKAVWRTERPPADPEASAAP